MKKFLKDASSKTTFTVNDKIYKHIDGVSMGSHLGPLLANISMTELKKDVIQKINDKKFMFYIWYVDENLLLVKDEDIDPIFKKRNSYNKNIKLTTLCQTSYI